jgi:hypothetical protein
MHTSIIGNKLKARHRKIWVTQEKLTHQTSSVAAAKSKIGCFAKKKKWPETRIKVLQKRTKSLKMRNETYYRWDGCRS